MSRSSVLSSPACDVGELLTVLACAPAAVLELCSDPDQLEARSCDDGDTLDRLAFLAAGAFGPVLAAVSAAMDIDCSAAAELALMYPASSEGPPSVLEVPGRAGYWVNGGGVWRLVCGGVVLVRLVRGEGLELPGLLPSVLRLCLASLDLDLAAGGPAYPELRASVGVLVSSVPLPSGDFAPAAFVAEWVNA